MSLRSQLILILALVAGCLFAILFRMVFYDKPAGAEDSTALVEQKPPVPVIVAVDNLEIGDELNAQNVRFKAFPEDMVAWDAITHFKDVKDRRLVRPVSKGHLISLLDLSDPQSDDGNEAIFIPPGFQPVPIEISLPYSKGAETLSIVMGKFNVQERVTLSIVVEDIQGNVATDGRPAQRKLMTTPICEDVEIYQVATVQRREDFDSEAQKILVVTVLLSQDQMAQVFAAIKTGNLVIVPQSSPESEYTATAIHGGETNVSPQSSVSQSVWEQEPSSSESPQPSSSSDPSSDAGKNTLSTNDFTYVTLSAPASHDAEGGVFTGASYEKNSPRPVPRGVFCPDSSSQSESKLDDLASEKETKVRNSSEKKSTPIYASSRPMMGAPRHYEEDPSALTYSRRNVYSTSSGEASVRPVGLLRDSNGTCYAQSASSPSAESQKEETKTAPRGVFAPRSSINWRDYVVSDR